ERRGCTRLRVPHPRAPGCRSHTGRGPWRLPPAARLGSGRCAQAGSAGCERWIRALARGSSGQGHVHSRMYDTVGHRSRCMRVSNSMHTVQPWRIHELTPDFRVEDVWALPASGGPDDFLALVRAIASGDPARSPSRVARGLWTIRSKVGELLGWDRP